MEKIYERHLQVTMIVSKYKERDYYTLEQFKKRDESFKLVIIDAPGLFTLGDKVTLRIGKNLDEKELVN